MKLDRKSRLAPRDAGQSAPAPRRRRDPRIILIALLVTAAAGGAAYWWLNRVPPVPAGFALGNGRLELDEIDIQTKFAGRVTEIHVDEGDAVHPGEVLARMDVADLQASLAHANAMIAQSEQVIAQSQADLDQARTSIPLMQREVARTQALLPRGYATQETLDQQSQQLAADIAAVRSAAARISAARASREAARQDAALIMVNIADNTLRAPKIGLIQYRLANLGEVLPAGGKLYTMLDTQYAYMDVFLPTAQAGLAVPGRDARVVLDARPDRTLRAHVTFLADQNQFTPKLVETRTERDKLMFRVRVRIDDADLGPELQAGLPGIAYIRLDPKAAWPDLSVRR